MSALTAAGALVAGCVVSFEDYPVGNLDAAGAAGERSRAGGAAGTGESTAGSSGAGGTATAGGGSSYGGTGEGGSNQGGGAGTARSGGQGGIAQTGGDAGSQSGGGGAPSAGGAGGVSGVAGTAASGGVAAAGAGGTAGIAGSAGGVAGFAGLPRGGTAGRGGEPGGGGVAGGGKGGVAGAIVGGAAGGGGAAGTAGTGGASGTAGGGAAGAAGGGSGGLMVGPAELVINEIDYDQESTDTDEFVEIFNTSTTGWVDLTGIVLVLVNGANPNNQVEYKRVPLAGELGPEQYLVIASDTVTVASGALIIRFVDADGEDIIQNGDPDGLALVDTTTGAILDALSYEGTVDRAIITGLSGEHNLVEGTETSVADVNVGLASLVRYPNGQDTDDASNDWWLSTNPTPGAANTL